MKKEKSAKDIDMICGFVHTPEYYHPIFVPKKTRREKLSDFIWGVKDFFIFWILPLTAHLLYMVICSIAIALTVKYFLTI